jgi:hypothetical protein
LSSELDESEVRVIAFFDILRYCPHCFFNYFWNSTFTKLEQSSGCKEQAIIPVRRGY